SLDSLKNAGLTEHQALYLKLFPDVSRLYLVDKYQNPQKIIEFDQVSDYVLNKFIGYEEKENVFLLLLDKKGKEVYCGMIAHGNFNSANFSIRDVVTLAINYGAVYAFLAHSHPSGLALPSRDDVTATIDVSKALRLVGVTLVDHFIVADHDCVSMAESGLFESLGL
ncbi:MAG: JAB domain-containing protein, partial [Ruminococcus sp.]|nr:JAB domain-containing protein [Ruminococcus sp.]